MPVTPRFGVYPGRVNDAVPADGLIRSGELVVRADTAYHSHAREAARKARGVKPRRMRQANKRHPKLPPGSTARTAAVGGYHVD